MTKNLDNEGLRSIFKDYDLFFIDLWGVIHNGIELYKEAVNVLTKFSYLIRKALSRKIDMKFLPKVHFVGDKSFDYAEKIEKLIQENK